MLYVETKYPREGCKPVEALTWHVGEKSLSDFIHGDGRFADEGKFENVFSAQADCDELEKIRRIFPALTPTGPRVCRWYGDIAKMILANIA